MATTLMFKEEIPPSGRNDSNLLVYEAIPPPSQLKTDCHSERSDEFPEWVLPMTNLRNRFIL